MLIVVLAGALVVGLMAVALVFVWGMRSKSPLFLKPFIRIQRSMMNPLQMRSAGTPGAYAGIIRHRGRVSGRSYETPIGPVPVEGGFLIALPYGSRTNWLRNVLAVGAATIIFEGEAYAVERPEVVPMHLVRDRFSAGDRRSFRLLNVDRALRVRRLGLDRVADGPAGATREGHTADAALESTHPMEVRHVA
jgi:hypothetical protein